MTSPTTLKRTEAELAFPEQYREIATALPGNADIRACREKAITAFETSGLPHRRVEAWKYTNLRQLLTASYTPAEQAQGGVMLSSDETAAHAVFATLERNILVFINGHFKPELSDMAGLEDGIEITTLYDALEAGLPEVTQAIEGTPDDNPMLNLNTALMRDGAVINVKNGIEINRPVHLVHINSNRGQASTLRHLVQVGEGASLTLLETHAAPSGGDEYLANSVIDAKVLQGGRLSRVKVQDEADSAIHYSRLLANVAADGRLRDFTLTLGGKIVRNEASVDFSGENADAHVSGAYFLSGRQHCDTSVKINHKTPECVSYQQFRGVVDDRAEGVFQGLVRVAPHAQKTDGRQMVRALLLSEGAGHFAKPELEIFADDVQCAHGATAGELDEDALFFLRARGIPEAEAKALLITAFIGEAIDDVEDFSIRERLAELSGNWLGRKDGA